MSTCGPVFVVDDEEPVRVSLGKLLRAIGFPNENFGSAEAFLASYEGGVDGCLLVDLRMPGMSGLDLIEELKRRGSGLAVILMTGHADRAATRRLEGVQPLGFLEKPFSVNELRALLDRWQSAGTSST